MKRLHPAALLSLLSLLVVPVVQAHAPPPSEEYQTRILTDYNDDWFGIQDGHNLVSLDLREGYNATLGDNVLIFRLMVSGGYAAAPLGGGSTLRDVIRFNADGQEKAVEFSTADNAVFTGTFDAVAGPEPVLVEGVQDGDRVFVTGIARFSSLGIQAGAVLSAWVVNGYADDAEGDTMPQGLAPGLPEPPGSGGQVWFDIGAYTVRDPSYYVALATDPATLTFAAQAEAGNPTTEGNAGGHGGGTEMGHGASKTTPTAPAQATVKVTVRNLLPATPQTVLVTATADGLILDLGNGSSRTVDLAGGASQELALTVTATNQAGTLPVHVMATSNLDGMAMAPVAVVVQRPPAPSNTTAEHHTDSEGGEEGKDTPGPPFVLLVGLLGAAIVMMRRRL